MNYEDSKSQVGEALLVLDVAVHGDHRVKPVASPIEKLAIGDTGPPQPPDRFDLMPLE